MSGTGRADGGCFRADFSAGGEGWHAWHCSQPTVWPCLYRLGAAWRVGSLGRLSIPPVFSVCQAEPASARSQSLRVGPVRWTTRSGACRLAGRADIERKCRRSRRRRVLLPAVATGHRQRHIQAGVHHPIGGGGGRGVEGPSVRKRTGKKREHGLDSGNSGLTTGAYVLSPAQGGGLLRAIIACNPHWLACCRGGRRIARNKPGGANAGDHIACNTSNASDTGRREQPTVAAAVPRQSGARGPVSGHAAWLRVRPAPLPALAPGTAGRGGKPKPPKIPSLVSAWPLRQFSSSGSRWSVGPKSPEAVGCQFGVPGGVLDVAMAQIMLDRARILAVVGELIASRMAQHVRVDREVDTGLASWGGRPNGVILHGSGIGRNVEGRVSGGLPAPGWRGTPSPSPPRQRHHLTPLVLHAMSSPALAPRFAACNTPPQKGHRVQL